MTTDQNIDYTRADEKLLRESEMLRPENEEELAVVIGALLNRKHDYGTSAISVALVGEAAMNFAAHKLGLTGFQFSVAEMALLARSRDMKCGGILVDFKDALYPQYDIMGTVRKALTEAQPQILNEAVKLAAKANEEAGKPETLGPSPGVYKHWKLIVNGKTPYIKS